MLKLDNEQRKRLMSKIIDVTGCDGAYLLCMTRKSETATTEAIVTDGAMMMEHALIKYAPHQLQKAAADIQRDYPDIDFQFSPVYSTPKFSTREDAPTREELVEAPFSWDCIDVKDDT